MLQKPEPLQFEFVSSAGDRLRCGDLHAAGLVAAAIRPQKLAWMAGVWGVGPNHRLE